MKTEKQKSPERAALCQLIQHMSVTMFTTVDDSGALISRPMLPLLLDGDGAVWFFTNMRSEKVKQRNVINLNFMDSTRATYVSLSGHGEIYSQRSFINRLWTPFAKPWFPDGPESSHLALLKFIPEIAEYWDSAHSKMVRMQATSPCIPNNAEPIPLGEREKVNELSMPAQMQMLASR